MIPAIIETTSAVVLADQCSALELWADGCESIPELRDANNRLAAIEEYLNRTSTEGRARVAEAQRHLEVRIGELLGPAERGGDRKSDQFTREVIDLSANERSQFRAMAEHPNIVEDVIAESTNDAPASRRKVINAIRAASSNQRRRSPLPDQLRSAVWDLGKSVGRLKRLVADDRFDMNKHCESLLHMDPVVCIAAAHVVAGGDPRPKVEAAVRTLLTALHNPHADDSVDDGAWSTIIFTQVARLAALGGMPGSDFEVICRTVLESAPSRSPAAADGAR